MSGAVRKGQSSFVTGSLFSALLKFAGPFMLGILVQNLYGAVDLLVVGNFATTADVSAVTIGSQLMNIATQLIIGLATGITVLVGRDFGAQLFDRLRRTIGTAALMFSAIALLVTAVFLIGNHSFVSLMQTPKAAIEPARDYIFVCSLGIIFITGYNVVTSILTGLGNSKTPFIFICVACVINVVLDLLLVCVFRMGALGAGIATTIAQAGSLLFSLVYLRRRGLGFPLSRADFTYTGKSAKSILTIGAPVAVQNIMVSISFLFIMVIINQIGLEASAAVGVVEKLIGFLFVPAIAMSTAVSTASAQNLGAGNMARARKSLGTGIAIALVPSVLLCVYCQFFGHTLTSLFSPDTEVIALATEYLRSYIVDVVMVAFVFSINGYLNSCNCSWFSLLHSLLTTFAVRIPLSYLFSRVQGGGLYLIGWASPLSTLASLVICIPFLLWLFRRQSKQSLSACNT